MTTTVDMTVHRRLHDMVGQEVRMVLPHHSFPAVARGPAMLVIIRGKPADFDAQRMRAWLRKMGRGRGLVVVVSTAAPLAALDLLGASAAAAAAGAIVVRSQPADMAEWWAFFLHHAAGAIMVEVGAAGSARVLRT